MPKCDRIFFVSDAEHVGEKMPFYNTYRKEGDDGAQSEGEGKKKKEKKLFFPSVR